MGIEDLHNGGPQNPVGPCIQPDLEGINMALASRAIPTPLKATR